MGQLLVDGVLTAPVTPTYYSQVAAAMVQAAVARKGGLYQSALRGAFVGRGILGLVAARDLEAAAVPSLQPVQAGGSPGRRLAAAAPPPRDQGASLVLEYDGASSDGYRADAASAPSLPQETVHAEFLDRPVTCHVAAERERFHVPPSTVGSDGSDDRCHRERQAVPRLPDPARSDRPGSRRKHGPRPGRPGRA